MQIIRLTTSCLHFAVLCQFFFLSLLCTWTNQTDLLASVNFAVWKDCHSLAGQPKLNYISKVNKTFIDNIYATIVLVIAQPFAFEVWTPRFFFKSPVMVHVPKFLVEAKPMGGHNLLPLLPIEIGFNQELLKCTYLPIWKFW